MRILDSRAYSLFRATVEFDSFDWSDFVKVKEYLGESGPNPAFDTCIKLLDALINVAESK